MIDLYTRNDPQWSADFLAALRELMGDELLLPSPPGEAPRIRAINPPPPRNILELEGSELRQTILEELTIKKTSDPCRREVWFGEEKAGECFKSP